jgi:hypothetical protein
MRRLLWLPLAAAFGVIGVSAPAFGQAAEEFGVLKTTPAPSAGPPPRPVPAGVEPVRAEAPPPSRPPNPYPVSPEAGAWMICAASYLGHDGPELSGQVARELREKHKQAAYIFNRGDEERQKQEDEFREMQKRFPGAPLRKKVYRVQDQYAVLVGGFKDFDHASAFLPKLMQLPAPVLTL